MGGGQPLADWDDRIGLGAVGLDGAEFWLIAVGAWPGRHFAVAGVLFARCGYDGFLDARNGPDWLGSG